MRFKEPIDPIQGTNPTRWLRLCTASRPSKRHFSTLETALRHPRNGTSAPSKRHFNTHEAAKSTPETVAFRTAKIDEKAASSTRNGTETAVCARKIATRQPYRRHFCPPNRHFQFFSPLFHQPIFSTKSLQNSKSRQRLTTKETARLPPTQTPRAISRNSKPVGSACSQRASGLQSNVKMGE